MHDMEVSITFYFIEDGLVPEKVCVCMKRGKLPLKDYVASLWL